MSQAVLSFVSGRMTESQQGASWENINPATEESLGKVFSISEEEYEKGLNEALEAQRKWAKKTGTERGRILHKASLLLREKTEDLALLETQDTGKPLSESLTVDIESAADAIEYFAGIASALKGDSYQLGGDFVYTRREPLGVVGGIGAWNYPIQIAAWKSAPALAAGNAMIFKPSEMTPRTALELAKVYKEAGLPDGLFQVFQGDHHVGKKMVKDERIHKISLTGEVGTGVKIMEAAAPTLKHLTFELGGKSPMLVFEDADIDQAVEGAMAANFFTQGEICSNGTRVYVHEKVLDAFTEKLLAETRKLKLGDPMDKGTTVGALISKEHQEKVLSYIEKGKEEKAQLLTGGKAWGEKGYFVDPTIFTNCTDEMTIVKEEIFGPVLSLLQFTDEDDVVKRANNTPYGLAAGLFTQDLNRAHRVSGQLEAGICWVNTYNETPVEIPFGGYKMSGFGRENSEWALLAHTQIKTVFLKGANKQ
jgi:betaine-aldehyde dehydrogenase